MKNYFGILCLACLQIISSTSLHADPTQLDKPLEFSFPIENVQANFSVWNPDACKGIFVIIAGYKLKIEEASIEEQKERDLWVNFAMAHHFGCVWLSLAFPQRKQESGGGYYAANKREHLISDVIQKSFLSNLPVYIASRNPDRGRFVLSLIESQTGLDLKGWCCFNVNEITIYSGEIVKLKESLIVPAATYTPGESLVATLNKGEVPKNPVFYAFDAPGASDSFASLMMLAYHGDRIVIKITLSSTPSYQVSTNPEDTNLVETHVFTLTARPDGSTGIIWSNN